jgi:uncharacterized Ntn-hydrolase superfamily protein
MRITLIIFVLFCNQSKAQFFKSNEPLAHTFSIVARDSATGEMAVAVQSHWFNVGAIVAWAESGVGVVATQSFVNPMYGYKGLELMRNGLTAQAAMDSLLKTDEGRDVRQLGFVDARGNVANYTGSKCIEIAGHIKGNQMSGQSNTMAGSQVNESMKAAFEKNKQLPLAERMVTCLEAAQQAGGDLRGQQSAALLLVPGVATAPYDARIINLRVDDHQQPIAELKRLLRVHRAYELMNLGDLETEKGNMEKAMQAYNGAMKLFPGNLEMQYWTGITLYNTKQYAKATALLKAVFAKGSNWKEMTKRLPKVGLLTITDAELKKLLQ